MTALAAVLALAAGPTPACEDRCVERVRERQRIHHMRSVVAPHRAWFERVARCESGGDWHTNTGNSFYGGLQFTLGSWRAVGGRGYPHKASKLRQMYAGVRLLRAQGPGAWPVCSSA
jgi:hypothetical protein